MSQYPFKISRQAGPWLKLKIRDKCWLIESVKRLCLVSRFLSGLSYCTTALYFYQYTKPHTITLSHCCDGSRQTREPNSSFLLRVCTRHRGWSGNEWIKPEVTYQGHDGSITWFDCHLLTITLLEGRKHLKERESRWSGWEIQKPDMLKEAAQQFVFHSQAVGSTPFKQFMKWGWDDRLNCCSFHLFIYMPSCFTNTYWPPFLCEYPPRILGKESRTPFGAVPGSPRVRSGPLALVPPHIWVRVDCSGVSGFKNNKIKIMIRHTFYKDLQYN